MITLTDQAVAKVKALLDQQDNPDSALRVFVQGGGCAGFKYGMTFDNTTEEGDEVYDFSGVKVLVDEMSSPYLNGAEVDYEDGLEGSGFSINNPNVESACGCGNSFKTKDAEAGAEAHSHAGGGGCGCH